MKATCLAVLATAMVLAHSAAAQAVFRYHLPIAEIQGSGWVLRYRTPEQARFLAVGQDRAFFVNGRSLRWIDTRKGVVLARWLLPEEIVRLTTESSGSGAVQVETQTKWYGKPEVHSFILDPQNPQTRWLPPSPWGLGGWSCEPAADLPGYGSGCTEILKHLTTDRTRAAIPRLAEMARRDSLSPWFHVFLGILRKRRAILARMLSSKPRQNSVPAATSSRCLPSPRFSRKKAKRRPRKRHFNLACGTIGPTVSIPVCSSISPRAGPFIPSIGACFQATSTI